MNKIFVTGDTHGELQIQRLSSKGWPDGKKLTKDDYLIICGDFGLIWENDVDSTRGKTERYWVKWLNDKSWTTLFIDGNHENHHRLQQLPIEEKFNGKVGKFSDNIYHLRRGEIYDICGKKFFCFGGALSRDRDHRRLNVSYWEEEVPSQQEMQYGIDNLNRNNNKIDYIISHTIPNSALQTFGFHPDYKVDPTTKYLDFVINNNLYTRLFCGHLHTDEDLEKISILWDRIIQIE